MSPAELHKMLHQQPFKPFRLVTTDGATFDIRHPDLMMVGLRSLTVGLTGKPGQTFYEQTVKIDLLHIVRIEPLDGVQSSQKNGPG